MIKNQLNLQQFYISDNEKLFIYIHILNICFYFILILFSILAILLCVLVIFIFVCIDFITIISVRQNYNYTNYKS